MRIPTVKIKGPGGRILIINESDLKFYVCRPGYTCDLRENKTSGGEPMADREHAPNPKPQESTDKPMDEKATTTLKRKMIIQPETAKPVMGPAYKQL